MLKGLRKLLSGLSSVDDGVESVLSPDAYSGLFLLVESVYGTNAANVVGLAFKKRKDGAWICVKEDLESEFLDALL